MPTQQISLKTQLLPMYNNSVSGLFSVEYHLFSCNINPNNWEDEKQATLHKLNITHVQTVNK